MAAKIGFLFAFIPTKGSLINSLLVTGPIIMQPIQDHHTTLSLLPGLPNSIKGIERTVQVPSYFCITFYALVFLVYVLS